MYPGQQQQTIYVPSSPVMMAQPAMVQQPVMIQQPVMTQPVIMQPAQTVVYHQPQPQPQTTTVTYTTQPNPSVTYVQQPQVATRPAKNSESDDDAMCMGLTAGLGALFCCLAMNASAENERRR